MKKLLSAIALIFISATCIKAQTAAKSIYAELGGPGIVSFNFDTRFSKTEGGLGGRIGIGGLSVGGSGFVTVPVGLNYLLSKDNKNYFEIGAGATYIGVSNFFTDNADNSHTSNVFGHMSFGYRLQPANGGFTFRAAIVPIFGKGFFVPYYAGISFGYKF